MVHEEKRDAFSRRSESGPLGGAGLVLCASHPRVSSTSQPQFDFLLGLSQVWGQGHIPGSSDSLGCPVVGGLWVLANILLHQLPARPYVTFGSYLSCTLDCNFLARRDCDLVFHCCNYII